MKTLFVSTLHKPPTKIGKLPLLPEVSFDVIILSMFVFQCYLVTLPTGGFIHLLKFVINVIKVSLDIDELNTKSATVNTLLPALSFGTTLLDTPIIL